METTAEPSENRAAARRQVDALDALHPEGCAPEWGPLPPKVQPQAASWVPAYPAFNDLLEQ